MLDQYSRTQLLLGEAAMETLRRSRVAVFGVGGVGGYTVEALARSGVGALDLIDDDRVCLTNLNRQLFATRDTVGRHKVDAAKARIAQIDPRCEVRTYKTSICRRQKASLILPNMTISWTPSTPYPPRSRWC